MQKRRQLRGKKLLIASAGLATVTFIGCAESTRPTNDPPPGNLMPPPAVETDEATKSAEPATPEGS